MTTKGNKQHEISTTNIAYGNNHEKQIINRENHYQEIIQQLTEYYNSDAYDEIGKLPKFKILESRDHKVDKIDKKDCLWYVTKQSESKIYGDFSFSNWQPKNYCEIRRPQQGDVVIYHSSKNGCGENHIGIYQGKNRLKSKFGYGHVYEHPVDHVPSNYGPYTACFTLWKDTKLGNWATIENMEEWIKQYGTICSLRVNFQHEFPEEQKSKIYNFLRQHPYFLEARGNSSFNIETLESNSSYEYKIVDDFLDESKNRQALRDFYFEIDKTNDNS